MRYIAISIILFFISQNGTVINAQQLDKNPVLIKSINKKYEGEIKRGLAHGYGKALGEDDNYEGKFKKGYPHGEGLYIWGNGNTYKGQFFKGELDGEGELVINRGGQLKDSILTGYFSRGNYIGKYKDPYMVTYTSGVKSVEFQKQGTILNQIKFLIYIDGKVIHPTLDVQDIKNTLWQKVGGFDTMVNVNFPLKDVGVSFSHGTLNYSFRFNIYEEGTWAAVISL